MRHIVIAALFLMASVPALAAPVEDLMAPKAVTDAEPVAENTTVGADVDINRMMQGFKNEDLPSKDITQTVLHVRENPSITTTVSVRKYVGTLVVIPERRRIKNIILGDSEGFSIKLMGKDVPNKLTVYPHYYGIDTNLTITDEEGRLYTFYLRSEKKDSSRMPHFAVIVQSSDDQSLRASVNWDELTLINETRPGGNPKDAVSEKDKQYLAKLSEKEYDFIRALEVSGTVNAGYRMFGDSAIAPNAVWDDGKQTYISFRDGTPSQRIPALYRLVDGYGTLTNSHYRDGFLVVDGISEEGWMLVDGTKFVCIKVPSDPQKPAKGPVETIENKATPRAVQIIDETTTHKKKR